MLHAENVNGILERQWSRKKSYVETVRVFTYHGDSLSAVGGFEAAVTVRTRYVWVTLRVCSELL